MLHIKRPKGRPKKKVLPEIHHFRPRKLWGLTCEEQVVVLWRDMLLEENGEHPTIVTLGQACDLTHDMVQIVLKDLHRKKVLWSDYEEADNANRSRKGMLKKVEQQIDDEMKKSYALANERFGLKEKKGYLPELSATEPHQALYLEDAKTKKKLKRRYDEWM